MTAAAESGAGSRLDAIAELPSDELARVTLRALLDSDALGVALLRAGDWVHLMANAAYHTLTRCPAVLGRDVRDVLPPQAAPPALLADVVTTGRTAHVLCTRLPPQDRGASGARAATHVSLTFLPVRSDERRDGVLVLVSDASSEVHERRIGKLFVLLARDMTADRDELATIRASVSHAVAALQATAASLFLLAPGGRRLQGAVLGWDWTRTSFVVDLDEWPNVARAIDENAATLLTAAGAERAEEGWFERRGIAAALCVPMAAGGRVTGVLFFDYERATPAPPDLALAKAVADHCALLIERAAARVE